LAGTFTHLGGVREGRSWLYAGNESLIGDLVDVDPATGQATFMAPFWSRDSPVQAGRLVPWLDGYWQPYHVTMIVAPEAVWRRTELSAEDAQHFEVGNMHGWRKVGEELPEGATAPRVEPGGWDHEHCEICSKHIGKGGDPAGYVDREDHWLCGECY